MNSPKLNYKLEQYNLILEQWEEVDRYRILDDISKKLNISVYRVQKIKNGKNQRLSKFIRITKVD